jgi:hypothetical protein
LKDEHELENIFHVGSHSLNIRLSNQQLLLSIFITNNSKIFIYWGSVHSPPTFAASANDYHIGPIHEKALYNDVKATYGKAAQDIGIFDEYLIEVIFICLQKIIQQHKSINVKHYILHQNLIEQMDLTSLFKYKTSQMQVFRKNFDFYNYFTR